MFNSTLKTPTAAASAQAEQLFMARRAHAHTVEINWSHACYISHPGAVTTLILQAAETVG